MCEPTTILAIGAVGGAALSAAGAAADHAGQQKSHDVNAQQANKAFEESSGALTVRQMEEMVASGQNIYSIRKQAQQAQAMQAVSAGESGVSGASVEALLDMTEAGASNAIMDVESNRDRTLVQLDRERQGQKAARDNRIAAVPEPSWALTSLRIGRSVLDAGTTMTRGLK